MIDWLENTLLIVIVIFLGACGFVALMSFYIMMFVVWIITFAMGLIARVVTYEK